MKMRIAIAVLALAALALPMGLAAQAKLPGAQLVYFENNSRTFTVTDDKGTVVPAKEGLKLGVGWTIRTGKDDRAEVELTHNKTAIKISPNTTFTIKDLGATKDTPNVLTVAAGKIRTVAGKATGDDRYRVEGGAAVCGVSGTDFIFTVPEDGSDAILQTLEGLVDFWKAADPGNVLKVGAKMAASFQQFVVSQIPDDVFNQLPGENQFQKLDPKLVPGSGAASEAINEIMAKVMKILGVEIGSITLDGQTWSKIVAQPNFKIGAVKAGLYLPLIYNGNMFDPQDWYHPEGNDEWSFGFDQEGVVDTVVDAVSDTFLKIKYFEWNDQRDPFFFKVGNLNDITIGHGLIMRDFANDADFPAVRRVGLNLGLDFGKMGFEYMVNDAGNLLTLPVVFSDATFVPNVLTGGRLYFQPLDSGKGDGTLKSITDLALGVSLLADFGASVDFYSGAPDNYTPEDAGKIVFLNPGVDLDVPIFETDFFGIVAFADAALMLPWLRTSPDTALTGGVTLPAGLQVDAVWDPDATIPFKNYGVAAGLFGNVWFIDWRLEYRYYTGAFKPAFYNGAYERSRSQYVTEVLSYLGSSGTDETVTMGVYGEGGFDWPEIVQLDIGYFWPWDNDPATALKNMDDRFIAKLTFQEIPVIHVAGSFSYERTGLVGALRGETGMALFDANTIVKAELAYPLVKDMLDVVLFYTTTPLLDADGLPVYDGSTWLPKMTTNLTIETRVRY